jgi:hypothetical protein
MLEINLELGLAIVSREEFKVEAREHILVIQAI